MALALSGCGADLPFMSKAEPSDPNAAALDVEQANGERSVLIDTLLARGSVLQPGPLAIVADAVMATNSRAAEADLRAAILRSEATQMNWLPTFSPSISLTELGGVVAQLVVDQVLFDNGRKRAEREIARADVEVAAVALSQDSNARVLEALELYVAAEAADARAAVSASGLSRMEHFEWVMSERVKGGINDQADLAAVSQRISQLRSSLANDRETAARARAELSAMMVDAKSGLDGLSTVGDAGDLQPLSVLKAEAEARRSMAQARAARAGFLPRIGLRGALSEAGAQWGVNAGADGIGFGMGASLQAIDAAQAAAQARVTQSREEAERELRGLSADLASARRKAAEAERLAAQADRTYRLFNEQLEAGQRAVPDVIGVYETRLRTAREAASARYDVVIAQLRIAALKGALVEGQKV